MVANKYKRYMYNMIKKAVDTIGPRPSCSDKEKELGQMMEKEWKQLADTVDVESFTCSPHAFLGFLPISVILCFIGIALYWFFPPAGAFFALIAFSMLFFEFMRYNEFIDFMFPKRQGENVIAKIKPRGEIKQRIIVSGHTDSAYEFNLWYWFKNASVPLMIIAIVGVLFIVGITIAKTVAFFTGGADAPIYTTLGYVALGFCPFISLFIVFHTYRPVPGAMDNMAGVSVTSAVGKYIDDAKKTGDFIPENTEIVMIAMSSEEAGLRGTKRYVKRHIGELKEIPSYGIFVDGVHDERHLTVTTLELCTGAKHDKGLVNLAIDAASRRGWEMKTSVVPIGASDASVFTTNGIPATCLLCQDTTKLIPNYHTRLDTPERIRPQALSTMLQVVLDMIERIDKGEFSKK
ncbi:MAG TPA: M28 family peptidase [bacterium]|nr:M28 family peptidase [bacterium]